MIIPVGHEGSELRRKPWVTFGILILCGLAFLATHARGNRALERAEDAVEAVFAYYLTHPYLELDPEFLDRFLPAGEQAREALIEGFRSFGPPPDAVDRGELQTELDRLTAEARAAIASHPFYSWGFVPADKSLAGLLTHMFLHAGWLHLLGNLLILYLAGPYIEDVWGRPLYGSFYVASGIVAAFSFALPHGDSSVPMIGASGAIAGVMGAFLVRYWHTKIRFFYIFGILLRGTFDAPAWIMLPLWFLQQLFFAGMTWSLGDAAGGGIAYLAHIGGFLFGVGAAVAIRHQKVEERWVLPAVDERTSMRLVDDPALERAAEAEAGGNVDEAIRVLAEAWGRAPGNEAVGLAFWDVAGRAGRHAEAAPAVESLVRDAMAAGRLEAAVERWEEMSRRLTNTGLDASVLLRIARAQIGAGRRGDGARTLRFALLRAGASAEPATALKIARLASDVDRATARAAARLSLSRPGLDPEERLHAERLLAATAAKPVSA